VGVLKYFFCILFVKYRTLVAVEPKRVHFFERVDEDEKAGIT
jgi:hypothetical protein